MFLRNCWIVSKVLYILSCETLFFYSGVLKLQRSTFLLFPETQFHISKFSVEWFPFRFAFPIILCGIFRKRFSKICVLFALV